MRRMFRRQIRKTLAQEVPPILQEANFAFDKGEYGRAGELFEQIAKTAEGRGGPRAPLFYLQAGRSRVYAGQTFIGMEHLKHGLSLFASRRQMKKVFNAGNRIVGELNQRGLKKEAEEIANYLKKLLPALSSMTEDITTKKAVLPTHCPSCGAPLRPDEVDWLDEIMAECGYCGSPVREED
jgi:hypothetical protein